MIRSPFWTLGTAWESISPDRLDGGTAAGESRSTG